MPTFRIDLHNHCSCDPIDVISYSAVDLIDRAVSCGLHAIAITPHHAIFDQPEAVDYAKNQGLLLIPGIEIMADGRELVILNPPIGELGCPSSFFEITRLKELHGEDMLVMAPHPFFPMVTCAGPVLDLFTELIDAVEYAHFYFSWYNPYNQRATQWAHSHSKPVLANSDAHLLSMVGKNFTEVEAEDLTILSLFKAIRAGKTRLVSKPHTFWSFTEFMMRTVFWGKAKKIMAGRSATRGDYH